MQVELVTIGTELLLGFTVDTNSAFLGRTLASAGVRVVRRTAVADQPAAIEEAVVAALSRTGAVITTGGLGPTRDDMTKKVVAGVFGWPLRFDEAIWAGLTDRWQRMGRAISDANRCQAEVPEGATVLPNRWGTAPGLWLEGSRGLVVMLPGVPREMRKLVEHEVVPRLAARGGDRVIRSAVLRTAGIPESSLAAKVGPHEDALAPLSLAYLPGTTGVDLRLTAWDLPAAEADQRLADGVASLRALVGHHAYGTGEEDLAALVLEVLRGAGVRLALAESCTGGMLGERLTAIAGSSEVLEGGVVAYSNAVKTSVLAVEAARLAEHGAVSEDVALAMARGAALRLGTEAAIGITGVAGPGGGTDAKPVGTVCFGWVYRNRERSGRVIFPGSRGEIRERACQHALHQLWLLAESGND